MSLPPIADLLAPFEGDAPCGPDLEYDPAFLAMEEALRGKPAQERGREGEPGYMFVAAVEPDWRAVHEQALSLAGRTRDLRVAVVLARAGARHQGLQAYAAGLNLVAGLLERHWEKVYPLLDADDNNDPTMRVNALLALGDPDSDSGVVGSAGGLADLRSAIILGLRSPLTVRQIELAAGKALPNAGETVPTQEGVIHALAAEQAKIPGLLDGLRQPYSAYTRIESVLVEKLGTGLAPGLVPLGVILKCLSDTAIQAQGGAIADESADHHASSAPTTARELRSRDDVVRALERACEWIERNEPTNPAPLLIRRAQRLMNKSFIDIIRDLVPEGLDQVEKIAGTAGTQ